MTAVRHRGERPGSEILVGEYGLKDTDLADFDTYLSSFPKACGLPRTTISLRSAATQTLNKLFLEADAYLDRMDRLSLNLEVDHPKFVLAYNSSRLIGAIPYLTKKAPAKKQAKARSKPSTTRTEAPVSPNGATANTMAEEVIGLPGFGRRCWITY